MVLALPGFLVFAVLAAIVAVGGTFWLAGAAWAWWNSGPNYTLAPTASCLRQHGYTADRIRRGTGDWNYPGLWISRRGDYLMSMYFTPSPRAAEKALVGMSVSAGARRNVATNLEVFLRDDAPVLACLRTE